ncbi:MAG: hypothetical protein WCP03_01960 [Candidatus Saccharibacteria bacterium]
MKKELYLDACVGFFVGMLVGMSIIVFSKIGFSLATGGSYDEPLELILQQTIPISLNWTEIFKFIAIFGVFFALLNPMYTYSKKGLRKQLAIKRQSKSNKPKKLKK